MARRAKHRESRPDERLRATARGVASSCLLFRTRAFSRRITSFYEEALRPLGLKPTQMNVMTALAAMGGARSSELASAIELEPSSLSRIVEVLRRNGWVEARPDPDDQRARRLELTPAGVALYRQALPLWRRTQRRVRAALGDADADAFAGLAERLLFERDGAPGPPQGDRSH